MRQNLSISLVCIVNTQIRKYPMFTLGATRDRALKLRTLDWAVKSDQVKLQDTFYPIGSVTGSVEGAQLAWKYFQEVRRDAVMIPCKPFCVTCVFD